MSGPLVKSLDSYVAYTAPPPAFVERRAFRDAPGPPNKPLPKPPSRPPPKRHATKVSLESVALTSASPPSSEGSSREATPQPPSAAPTSSQPSNSSASEAHTEMPGTSHSADAQALSGIQNSLETLLDTVTDVSRVVQMGHNEIIGHIYELSNAVNVLNRERNDISTLAENVLDLSENVVALRDRIQDSEYASREMFSMLLLRHAHDHAEVMNALTLLQLQQQNMQTTAEGETRVAITEVRELIQDMMQSVLKGVCVGVAGSIVVACLLVVFCMVADYLHGLFTAQTQDYLGW
ncbi:hypothetical protein F5Y05DRAFT_419736 [Hypoxylon sp. FL0543]|nr:hypothetical protein F5Y05DRAFT_419736 [Hypoxylon sp. FL0543]